MHTRSSFLFLGLLAAVLTAPAAAQTTYVVIPEPEGSEHASGLLRAAEKLVLELEAATSLDWAVSEQTRPLSVPAPANTGLIVRIEALTSDPISDTGYYVSIGSGGEFVIRTRTMEGAIDGVHGVRLRLMMDGYTGGFMSGGTVTVEPAFVRRGFMLLVPEPHWTQADWVGYIDTHQLLGANVLTVGIPGIYDPSDERTRHFERAYDALVAAMDHCHDVGVKFQITAGATMMSSGFYWDHFEPEHALYDGDGTTVTLDDPAQDDAGAESHDGSHEHELLYFPPMASISKVTGDAGLAAELADHQATFYEMFARADAFLVGFTETGADYGADAITDPEAGIVEAHLDWIAERIADGHAQAGGSDPEPGAMVYFGWLHDLWWRWALADANGDGYASHSGFSDWPDSTYSILDSYLDPDPGDANVRSEWIQETGALYFDMDAIYGVVAQLNPSLPESVTDPLGYVAEVEVSSSPVFDTTAFLYWCHEEGDMRNYFPRPAIRETILELRAALRKQTLGVPEWDAHPPATGVMGYRFASPDRRFLNDFAVLRCASDRALLELGTADLDQTGLDALQDALVAEMASFLLVGDGTHLTALETSIDALDDARPLFSAVDPAGHAASLDALFDGDVAWWEGSARLRDYYQLLAFTTFTELAADATTQSEEDLYAAAAIRVARQTPLLEEYVSGHKNGAVAKVRALVAALGQ